VGRNLDVKRKEEIMITEVETKSRGADSTKSSGGGEPFSGRGLVSGPRGGFISKKGNEGGIGKSRLGEQDFLGALGVK